LEQKYFNDPKVFELIVEAENTLVDEYARGALSPEVRKRFEEYYLAHPQRRERAKFADALAAKVGPTQPSGISSETFWRRLWAPVGRQRLAWASSFALVVVAAIAVWYFLETRRLRHEFAHAESRRAAQQQRERELQQQLSNEQQRSTQLAEELARQQADSQVPPPSPETSPAFASLVLTIAGTRSGNLSTPSILRISPETGQVRIQLNLREAEYSFYSAGLTDAGGQEIFSWRRLTAKPTRQGSRLTLVMPANKLTKGDYILTLKGAEQSGETEDISKSLFRVERN
jgi:hypothetical protein